MERSLEESRPGCAHHVPICEPAAIGRSVRFSLADGGIALGRIEHRQGAHSLHWMVRRLSRWRRQWLVLSLDLLVVVAVVVQHGLKPQARAETLAAPRQPLEQSQCHCRLIRWSQLPLHEVSDAAGRSTHHVTEQWHALGDAHRAGARIAHPLPQTSMCKEYVAPVARCAGILLFLLSILRLCRGMLERCTAKSRAQSQAR